MSAMNAFAVYVLYSESADRLYIGYSANSVERFRWHDVLARKGFTCRYRPWKMVHIEFFSTKSEAMLREAQLKGGQGREFIRQVTLPELRSAGFISA
jgi:putative endonuclease